MYHADQTGYYGFVSRFPSLCNARTTSTEWIRGRGTLRILNLSLHGLRYVIKKKKDLQLFQMQELMKSVMVDVLNAVAV